VLGWGPRVGGRWGVAWVSWAFGGGIKKARVGGGAGVAVGGVAGAGVCGWRLLGGAGVVGGGRGGGCGGCRRLRVGVGAGADGRGWAFPVGLWPRVRGASEGG